MGLYHEVREGHRFGMTSKRRHSYTMLGMGGFFHVRYVEYEYVPPGDAF